MDSPWRVIGQALVALEQANEQAVSQGQAQIAPDELIRDLEWVQKWNWIGEGGHWPAAKRDSDFAWRSGMTYSVLSDSTVVTHDDTMEGRQWAVKQDCKRTTANRDELN